MSSARKNHPSAFKAKVALAALRGGHTGIGIILNLRRSRDGDSSVEKGRVSIDEGGFFLQMTCMNGLSYFYSG